MAALCWSAILKEAFKTSHPSFIHRSSSRLCSSLVSERKPTSTPEVIIPSYIPRGPTDILRALASTVRRDPTAPHYIFHDDPHLIPTTFRNSQSFALSKESGKRAARYFLENFPENFENDEAEPKIPAFNPSIKITDLSDVSVEMLKELVHNLDVNNAFQVYSKLEKDNVKIEHEIMCELLELLCYYNGLEPADETSQDERWYKFYDETSETKVRWQDDGPAETLFEKMEVKDARAYQAIIQGTARFYNPSRAEQLYTEMKEKGFVGSTRMYNCLIHLIPKICPAVDIRWEKAEEYLQTMVQEGIEPDVITFNSLLFVLASMPGFKRNSFKGKASSILAEMKALDIQPSLATFTHILQMYYHKTAHASDILDDIMDIVESKEWDVKDVIDLSFFQKAMTAATKYMLNLDTAQRIHAAITNGNNRKFLKNEHQVVLFYKDYFILLCSIQTPDEFLPVYERIVPNDYIPSIHIMHEIITAVKYSKQLQHLPKFWSDVLMFRMADKDLVVRTTLSAIIEGGKQDDQVLQEQLVAIAYNIFDIVKAQSLLNKRYESLPCTGDLLGDLLTIFLNEDSLEKSWQVVVHLTKNKHLILGHPSAKPLLAFCNAALDAGDVKRALTCLGYACDENIPEADIFLRENASKIPKHFLNRHIS